jgi:hypothetical protein
LAFDMAAIEISVKNAFISLYYTEPWLTKFHANNLNLITSYYKVENNTVSRAGRYVTIPQRPQLGDFDVREVLKSRYMLS